MKRLLEKIKNYPIIFVLIVTLCIFLPTALASPPESDKRTVATAMGIDSMDGDLEVSIISLLPLENITFTEQNIIVSAVAPSVAEAVVKLSLYIGKEITLSHVEIIVLGIGLADKNCYDIIKDITKWNSIEPNALIVTTNKTAKEILKVGQNLSAKTGLRLQEIVLYNEDFTSATQTTVEAFFKGTSSPTKSVLLGYIELTEQSDYGLNINNSSNSPTSTTSSSSSSSSGGGISGSGSGSETGSSGSSGGSSSGGGEQNSSGGGSKLHEKTIKNNGNATLFVDGNYKIDLDYNDLRGINWISRESKNGIVEIEEEHEEIVHRSIFRINDKRVKLTAFFERGKPVLDVKLSLKLIPQEHKGNDEISFSEEHKEYIDEEIQFEIESKIKDEFSVALQKLKPYNADVFGVYNLFDTQCHGEFQKYLKSLSSFDSFLSDISFRIGLKLFEY